MISHASDSERTLKKLTEETGKGNVALSHCHTFSYIIHLYIQSDLLLKGMEAELTEGKVYWNHRRK